MGQKPKRRSIIREFYELVRSRKSYWLVPVIIVLLALAGFVILGSTAAAPFIYTLF